MKGRSMATRFVTDKFGRAGLAAFGLLLAAALCAPTQAGAAPGNAQNGAKTYNKRCWWCHGKKGEANGPAAPFLVPPPRDFSLGVYKYKTSAPTTPLPRDEDLFNRITNGMPGTGMPAWNDVLSEQDRWDVVAYIKTLTDLFGKEPSPPALDFSKKKMGADQVEKGKKAFQEAKCFECHGQAGKGDLSKKLKEDSGIREWPRNLTKPWTFRGGYTPEDIFSRVSNGIPNTQMNSFAAATTGNGKLSEEDRWAVVNYVMSLADYSKQVKDGVTVVKGIARETLPKDENDPAWDTAPGTAYFLVPQIIQKERFFTPTNDGVKVKAFYNATEVAFLLELDDRTKSMPGDSVAESIAWDALTPDAMAIQMPIGTFAGNEKPYFGHGDPSHAVSMLYWSAGTVQAPNVTKLLDYTGSGKREEIDPKTAGFTSSASYKDGTWRVMMKRTLTTANKDKVTQLEPGQYVPIAFANWDGSNGEAGSKHTLTTWYWLLLMPPTGSEVVVIPLVVFFALVGGQLVASALMKKK